MAWLASIADVAIGLLTSLDCGTEALLSFLQKVNGLIPKTLRAVHNIILDTPALGQSVLHTLRDHLAGFPPRAGGEQDGQSRARQSANDE